MFGPKTVEVAAGWRKIALGRAPLTSLLNKFY